MRSRIKNLQVECIEENKIVRPILPPGAIVENDGVFVLLSEDDPELWRSILRWLYGLRNSGKRNPTQRVSGSNQT